jgi:putative nucleotidyltransferase with HDIG domain
MGKTFPSTIAIGSLGIFLYMLDAAYNQYIILIFFIPLLLARYSFKLYFDSQRMALDTIHALNEALHAKDAYTGGHTGRVEKYATDLAKAYGLATADVDIIRTAALLHDIGKIGIPDNILNKPGKLSNEEFHKIQEHSTIGAKILGNVYSLKKVSHIIVQHHEKYDGSGYPSGLKGDEISVAAMILMISDSYDAMTTDRPYRKALTKEKAISELVKYSGTQFHPELAKCFIEEVLIKENEKPRIEENILEKTKEVVEAGSDLPKELTEPELGSHHKKRGQHDQGNQQSNYHDHSSDRNNEEPIFEEV